jgi:sugar phosphate isomerase/epimerase
MYYDVGNTVWLGLGYSPQWIRQIGAERIVRIHFKDAVPGKWLPGLLEGGVDWPGVRQALADIGYDRWVCAELALYEHCPARLLERTVRDLEAIWALPAE